MNSLRLAEEAHLCVVTFVNTALTNYGRCPVRFMPISGRISRLAMSLKSKGRPGHMPVNNDRSMMASHEQRGSDVGARNLRVLAVDDDHNILALLQTALASMGSYEIALAHSGG